MHSVVILSKHKGSSFPRATGEHFSFFLKRNKSNQKETKKNWLQFILAMHKAFAYTHLISEVVASNELLGEK